MQFSLFLYLLMMFLFFLYDLIQIVLKHFIQRCSELKHLVVKLGGNSPQMKGKVEDSNARAVNTCYDLN